MGHLFPVLFVSHGAPTFATEPGVAGPLLSKVARELPQTDAIVVISPHWMTAGATAVTASPAPATLYDFSGFPAALYALQYPAPGSPALAAEIVRLLVAAGWKARLDSERGLDHGAWVPLLHLAPAADIPVVQVSMPMPMDSHAAFRFGQALMALRRMRVLLVASGGLTHNLAEFRCGTSRDADYVKAFTTWTAETLQAGKTAALLDYRATAPAAERAHPTDDHFLPLLIALGAAGDAYRARRLEGGITYGVLAMDSYLFETPFTTPH